MVRGERGISFSFKAVAKTTLQDLSRLVTKKKSLRSPSLNLRISETRYVDHSYASTKATRDQTTNHTILKYKEAGHQKTRRLRVFT